jgi:8-oxo-dGTP pyrophosphatase MutT (NUDIX family)
VKKLRANTAKPVVLAPIWPNVGVQVWYQQQLDALVSAASADLIHELTSAWNRTPPLFHGFAQDAAPIHAAGVRVRSQGRVLLMHRTDGQGWAWPAGGVEADELPDDTARRELFEETLHVHNGPFFEAAVSDGFATFSTDVLEPFVPQLNSEHDAAVWVTPEQALTLTLHPGVRKLLEAGDEPIAFDAAPPTGTKGLQAALAKWGQQTIKRFDLMAKSIADAFAARSKDATETAMRAQLKKAGFTVKFVPTQKSVEAYRAVAAENIALIRSIPRKYHEQVEQKVWNAVRVGSDLNKLSTDLRKTHKLTVDRAALIARDQNAKAKATIERVRQMELGITRGIWMHSHAGKEPRPTHVKMNDTEYDLAKGMYDSDEGEWVHPGQLINCRCTNRPVIEGFE